VTAFVFRTNPPAGAQTTENAGQPTGGGRDLRPSEGFIQPLIDARSPVDFRPCLVFNEQNNRMTKDTFGARVRREREQQKIGLRQAAKKIGVSPTYLSMVERDEFPPPAEDRVRAIAKLLELDEDELLALAGKVGSDLRDIIRKRPREMASFLRSVEGLTPAQLVELTKRAEKAKK
jgi:HTH-type transcriptional regulator, competence development regulator